MWLLLQSIFSTLQMTKQTLYNGKRTQWAQSQAFKIISQIENRMNVSVRVREVGGKREIKEHECN